jgi:hypothetical protein
MDLLCAILSSLGCGALGGPTCMCMHSLQFQQIEIASAAKPAPDFLPEKKSSLRSILLVADASLLPTHAILNSYSSTPSQNTFMQAGFNITAWEWCRSSNNKYIGGEEADCHHLTCRQDCCCSHDFVVTYLAGRRCVLVRAKWMRLSPTQSNYSPRAC